MQKIVKQINYNSLRFDMKVKEPVTLLPYARITKRSDQIFIDQIKIRRLPLVLDCLDSCSRWNRIKYLHVYEASLSKKIIQIFLG